jgi:hypothetical protein
VGFVLYRTWSNGTIVYSEEDMSWESIGSTNTGQMPHDEAWILFSIGMAKQYILFVCGDPPEGSKLDVMWHDHELGSYPSL